MSMQAVYCDPALLAPHSFRMLYEESHKTIYKIAYSMLKNEHDAWDVTQNVYIKILMKADTLRDPEKLRSWMVTMTYNECKNMLKAQRRSLFRLHREADISEMETFTDIESPELGPIDCMEADEMRNELRTFLNRLPDEQKNTLFLYYYEQRSIDEIAALSGCTANTVKSRLNYGKKKMRHMINDYESRNQVTLRCSVLLPILGGIWHIKNATVVASSIAAAAAACVISTNVLPSNNQTKVMPDQAPVSAVTTVCNTTTATTTTTAVTTLAAVAPATTAPTAEPLAFVTETTVQTTTTAASATTAASTEATLITTTQTEISFPSWDEFDWSDDCGNPYWDGDGFCWWEDNCWWEGDCGKNDENDDTETESDCTDDEGEEEEVLLPDSDLKHYRDEYRPDHNYWWYDDDCFLDESEETQTDATVEETVNQLELDAQELLN